MSQGVLGFLDFTGLPSGQAFTPPTPPAPPGPIGLSGFLGFPFLPVGQGTGLLVVPAGHGSRGAGKPAYSYAVYYWYVQRLLANRKAKKKKEPPPEPQKPKLDMLVEMGRRREEVAVKRQREGQMYSVLLAVV